MTGADHVLRVPLARRSTGRSILPDRVTAHLMARPDRTAVKRPRKRRRIASSFARSTMCPAASANSPFRSRCSTTTWCVKLFLFFRPLCPLFLFLKAALLALGRLSLFGAARRDISQLTPLFISTANQLREEHGASPPRPLRPVIWPGTFRPCQNFPIRPSHGRSFVQHWVGPIFASN